MTFEQAARRYQELKSLLQARRITEEQFRAGVDELRVQDAGVWWQLSYEGHWLYWTGKEWAVQPNPSGRPGYHMTVQQVQKAAGYANTAYSAAQSIASGNTGAALGKVAGALRPLAGKSQKWWNVVSILGGGIGGGLWYWYSTLDRRPDPITSFIMLIVPVALIFLRRPIDRQLAKLMPFKRKLPRLLVVGIGIAAPFFLASFLYDSMRIANYPLIRWSVFLGPLLSYIIIRTPEVQTQYPQKHVHQHGRR
ncbi:MAG: hypothetical protein N2491_03155 [Negativicutes bacterium]|nr:hypothetical protein [Negativicutes bacterium]